MQKKGTVQEPYASKHPEFRYRRALKTDLAVRQAPPDHAPSRPVFNTVEVADYELTMRRKKGEDFYTIEVTMLPNEYTQANQPKVVVRFFAGAKSLPDEIEREAMHRAFG